MNYLYSRETNSPSLQLQMKTLQMALSVFQSSEVEVRNPFIQSLGPEVVRLVEKKAEPVTTVIEALQVLEMLLELTPETHSKFTVTMSNRKCVGRFQLFTMLLAN